MLAGDAAGEGLAGAGLITAGKSAGSTGLFWQPMPLTATSMTNVYDMATFAD